MREQCLLFLYGDGDNRKTVFRLTGVK